MGSSGKTTTVQQQGPPQLLDEGKVGYKKAQDFYQSILGQPPVYEGERVAPFSPAQVAAQSQSRDYFGHQQGFQRAGEGMITGTEQGQFMPGQPQGYNEEHWGDTQWGSKGPYKDAYDAKGWEDFLTGKNAQNSIAPVSGATSEWRRQNNWQKASEAEIQSYIKSASEPLLTELNEKTMPGIRDSSQIAGQGITSTRGDVARQQAVEGFGRTVGSSVMAGVFNQQQALQQDYTKALDALAQAEGEGDANRITQARIATASIKQQMEQLAAGERTAYAGRGLTAREGDETRDLQGHEGFSNRSLQAHEGRATRGLAAYEGERGRQMQGAIEGIPALYGSEALRLNQLDMYGGKEQSQYQKYLDAERQRFEEPLARQSGAASSLLSAGGHGSGSSVATTNASQSGDITGDVTSGAMALALTYALLQGKK